MSSLPASTRMGAVELAVADLQRSISYYEQAVGLQVQQRGSGEARLGAGGQELLRLVERLGAKPARGFSGLYHFALLLPQRADLARWLAHAARERVPIVGLSDHFVSEAIYLSDPDEHGIEIYWDRPREVWEGQVAKRMTTLPLDVSSLMGELQDPASEPFEGLPAGTSMGHVHLRVSDVPATLAFYRDALGFDLTAAVGGQAAFLAAGGYHHHIGANTWESAGAGQAPESSATLLRASVLLPDAQAVRAAADSAAAAGDEPVSVADGVQIADPSGNPLLLAHPA
jgi:catechol 2,3-dioxygenase